MCDATKRGLLADYSWSLAASAGNTGFEPLAANPCPVTTAITTNVRVVETSGSSKAATFAAEYMIRVPRPSRLFPRLGLVDASPSL